MKTEIQNINSQIRTVQENDTCIVNADKLMIVTFNLGMQLYGINVKEIQEIIAIAPVTHIPRTMQYLEGVLSLRGKIIPVIDLRKKVGLGHKDKNSYTRIIILNCQEVLGLMVDKVQEVIKIENKDVSSSDVAISSINGDYIEALVRSGNQVITILKTAAIASVSVQEKEEEERRMQETSRENYLKFLREKMG